ATPQSPVCGMDLFNPARFDSINRISRQPNHQLSPSKCLTQLPHGTKPSSVFIQQELKDWIEWFLSLPEVEASIENCNTQKASFKTRSSQPSFFNVCRLVQPSRKQTRREASLTRCHGPH
ncbi:hypothetical protein VP01_14942g1, partial [Puccinia sorghi]